jgi:hypothetical protein
MRRVSLASVALAAATTMIALAFGAEVGLAADYEDGNGNVCEGSFDCSTWGSHVTGSDNIALGFDMMPELKGGNHNVALTFGALFHNTTGSDNIASGFEALASNTEGNDNLASGKDALASNTKGSQNVASGKEALARNTTGNQNVASGTEALHSNTGGEGNVASGTSALFSNTAGNNNVASGTSALLLNTTGSFNAASGYATLFDNTTGGENVASGFDALERNTTGFSNVALGNRAGAKLTTGSNNIDIANEGVAAESGTTRIGSEGKQTRAFVAGVYQKGIAPPACSVLVNSEGQLGCSAPRPGVGAVATFASRSKTLSGNCLAYTDIGPAGSGVCPAKTTGFSTSTRLAPMPGNGGAVDELYADSNATVTGTDKVEVAVIDNTTGAGLISCTLTSSSPHSCTNTSGSAATAAGDNVEVKITPSGASGNEKMWRVTFRF